MVEGRAVKSAVFSEYPRCPSNVSEPNISANLDCTRTNRSDFAAIGYSVRTMAWRYTIWLNWDGANLVGDFSRSRIGHELYDHSADSEEDFDARENKNVADDPANGEVVARMLAIARGQWEKASQ